MPTGCSSSPSSRPRRRTSYSAVGQVLRYTITVQNTGNVTLTGVTITDTLTGDESCPDDTVAAGDTMECTASYAVTQDDLDDGSITNTATIDTNQTGPKTGTTTVRATQTADFTVAKTANAATYNAVDQVLRYTITVTNTGNVTLTGVTIADPLTGDESCPDDTVAAGDTMECTASYTVTQADLDAGMITNIATIDTNQTGPKTGTTIVDADRLQQFTVVKATTATSYSRVGQVLNYTITVQNTGNITLTGLTITDALTDNERCPHTTLVPADTMTCTASYTVTQDDLDAGSITNIATVDSEETEERETNEVTVHATVNAERRPDFTVVKTVDADSYNTVGETLNYTITVTNTGDVTLTGVTIDDVLTDNELCPDDTLDAGTRMTCTASYTVKQTDLDAGSITNIASVDSNEAGPETGSVTLQVDDATIRDRTKRVISNFLSRRADQITASDIDLVDRLIHRRPSRPAKLDVTGSGTKHNNHLSFAASLRSALRANAAKRDAGQQALLGRGTVMASGPGRPLASTDPDLGVDVWAEGRWCAQR